MKGLLLVIALVLLLLWFFRSGGKPATLEETLEALEDPEDPLEETEDLAGYAGVGGAANTVRFINSRISIFYFMSLFTGPAYRKVETFDFYLGGRSGGYKITFANDEVEQWFHNGQEVPLEMLHPERKRLAHKILEIVRAAYNSDEDVPV